jgi:hypothetical protein
MSHKTITKFSAFVIFFAIAGFIFSGCSRAASGERGNENINKNTKDKKSENGSKDFAAPRVVGKLESAEIGESSGVAASRCNANAFWTHNDSGNQNIIYAFNRTGEHLGAWRVAGAKNYDWEDIAAFQDAGGECFLYIGDIGNNVRGRGEFIIYRVKEPQISAADKSANNKNARPTAAAEAIKITYPEMRHDAETLLVHPNTGDIYVITKRLSGAAGVYKLAANYATDKINTLEKIADFTVPAVPNAFLTGGDISPDGKRVVICDYFNAYEIALPDSAKNFDEIWRQKPVVIQLGERQQGEAVAYGTDGNTIYATSENKNSPVIEVKRK